MRANVEKAQEVIARVRAEQEEDREVDTADPAWIAEEVDDKGSATATMT